MLPLEALALAASLMHQPMPDLDVLWLKRSPTRAECANARPVCYAMTATTKYEQWIIIAPPDAPAEILVHEACHAIQTIREGRPYSGRIAEAECEAVAARSEGR